MKKIYLILFITQCFMMKSALSKTTIAVIGKTINDSFYEASYMGCLEFAKTVKDLTCIYDGPKDFQDVRGQAIVINRLLKNKIDGLLVSTTDSDHLVKRVIKKNPALPVITFDSDLEEYHNDHRLTYVGTNNFDFGKALGEYTKRFKTSGKNEICLQTGHQTTPNLNKRMEGVRFALAGKFVERLKGENGWYEHNRCPLYTNGRRPTAVFQLETLAQLERPPIIVAVAGFAQFSSDYIKKLMPFREKIKSQKLIIISADTEDIQLHALRQGLSTVNIGQKPFEMGRKGAELLYDYLKNRKKPSKDKYYLDYHYCTQKDVITCIKK